MLVVQEIMEDPAGYDPVAAGLKDQSLSIRVYARGPKTPFAIVAHGMCSLCLHALMFGAPSVCRPRDLSLIGTALCC